MYLSQIVNEVCEDFPEIDKINARNLVLEEFREKSKADKGGHYFIAYQGHLAITFLINYYRNQQQKKPYNLKMIVEKAIKISKHKCKKTGKHYGRHYRINITKESAKKLLSKWAERHRTGISRFGVPAEIAEEVFCDSLLKYFRRKQRMLTVYELAKKMCDESTNLGNIITFVKKNYKGELPKEFSRKDPIVKEIKALIRKRMGQQAKKPPPSPPGRLLTLEKAVEYLIAKKIARGKIWPSDLAGLDITQKEGQKYYIQQKDLDEAVKNGYFKFVPVPKVIKELGLEYLYEFKDLLREQGRVVRIFWFDRPFQYQVDFRKGYILKGYIPILKKALQEEKEKEKYGRKKYSFPWN